MKIIQITDIHLFSDPAGTLFEINTLDSFRAVLQAIKNDPFATDLILLTGDLIQDDKSSTYDVLAAELENLAEPVYWLPGNHDLDKLFSGELIADNIHEDKLIANEDWQLILLNSRIPGCSNGLLSEYELQFLGEALKNSAARFSLICMHHPPYAVDSPWLDEMMLKNSKDLYALLATFESVKGILSGHVHQAFDGYVNNIKVMTTPSTCAQFKPHTESFTLDDCLPGYRRLHLKNDGSIDTSIARLSDFNGYANGNNIKSER